MLKFDRMKSIFFMLCSAMLGVCSSFAQTTPRPVHARYSPGGYLDHVFDKEGNKFSLGEIAIDNEVRRAATSDAGKESGLTIPSSCSSGYFQLYLETGCGMEGSDFASMARLNVLCQVLQDISKFINSPCTVTGQKVNIIVRNYKGISVPGVGSPFYNIPYSTSKSGIADNTAWITINSGIDAFTGVSSPLSTSGGGSLGSAFFHASIRFDFSGTIKWHTDLTSVPLSGEFDLYTCAMHEVMHTLGFCSLIDYNGNSVIGPGYQYYTRYDEHLQTQSGKPLVPSSSSLTQMYQRAFNTALIASTTLSPGGWSGACASGYTIGSIADNTPCATALQYSGSTTVKVYTPLCFEKGSSLSHFEDQCYTPPSWFTTAFPLPDYNNQYFPMANACSYGPYSTARPGAMKRYLKPEERQVLCDMGYSVNSKYGNAVNNNYYDYGSGSSCPGLNVVGINDGISGGAFVYKSSGGPVTISVSALLSNDYGVTGGSVSCMEPVNGAGTVAISGGSITYTPAPSDFGVQLLRYIPKSASGAEGNITYVYVYVGDPACTATPCDFVSNGNFENTDPGLSGPYLPGVHCWYEFNTADIFSRGTTGYGSLPVTLGVFPTGMDVHPHSTLPNDHFAGFIGGASSTTDYLTESIASALSTPLVTGNTYVISFWATINPFSPGHFSHILPAHLAFSMSPDLPLVSFPYTITGPIPGLSVLNDFIIVSDSQWHYYTATITYTDPAPANTLVIYMEPWLNIGYPANYAHYVGIDDISIKQATAACSFTLPSVMCIGTDPIDLSGTVGVPGGKFEWLTDSLGHAVNTDSVMFNPATAYTALAILSGDTSLVTVKYTYADVMGCVGTVYAQTKILPLIASAIIGKTSISTDSTTNLSDATPGGTWSIADTFVAIISPTGVVTGKTGGTTRVTYTLSSGCFVTVPFMVQSTAVQTSNPMSAPPQLSLIPNPGKGIFALEGHMQSDHSDDIWIDVLDMVGKVVYHDKITLTHEKIDKQVRLPATIPDGVYIIKVHTDMNNLSIRYSLIR